MNTTPTILFTSVLFVLGAVVFAGRESGQRRDVEAEIATAQRARASSQARVSAAMDDLRSADKRRIELEQSLADMRTKAAAEPTRANKKPAAAAPSPSRPNLFELFAAHPDFHALYLKALSSSLEARYAPLFDALALTPEQKQQFAAAMAREAASVSDISTTARVQGLSATDPAIKALREQADAQLATDLRGTLGGEGYRQFEDYRRTLPQREQANELVTHYYMTEAPLTLVQVNRLTEIFAAHDLQPKISAGGFVPTPAEVFTTVVAKASTVLTPMQMPTFEMVMNSYRAMQAIQHLTHQAAQRAAPMATAGATRK